MRDTVVLFEPFGHFEELERRCGDRLANRWIGLGELIDTPVLNATVAWKPLPLGFALNVTLSITIALCR